MVLAKLNAIEVFGEGVERAEGVVVDTDGCAWGGGRNGIVYRVDPEGLVKEVAQLPDRAIPNGVTMDGEGNFIYCDLRRGAVMRLSREGKVSLVADRAGTICGVPRVFRDFDGLRASLRNGTDNFAVISTVLMGLFKLWWN